MMTTGFPPPLTPGDAHLFPIGNDSILVKKIENGGDGVRGHDGYLTPPPVNYQRG